MAEPTDLLGRWVLARTVEDRLAGEHRSVRGHTTLVQESADLVRWHEEGTMTWTDDSAQGSVPVSRSLEVRREHGVWTVHFADGRVFHPWAVGEAVDHACAPDHYRGLIEATGRPVTRWSMRWEAHGPHKDYVMLTEHTPS